MVSSAVKPQLKVFGCFQPHAWKQMQIKCIRNLYMLCIISPSDSRRTSHGHLDCSKKKWNTPLEPHAKDKDGSGSGISGLYLTNSYCNLQKSYKVSKKTPKNLQKTWVVVWSIAMLYFIKWPLWLLPRSLIMLMFVSVMTSKKGNSSVAGVMVDVLGIAYLTIVGQWPHNWMYCFLKYVKTRECKR